MRALWLVVVLGGCFKPNPQEGLACGPDNWCPEPLRCASDGACRSVDPTSDANEVDAPDAMDATDDGSRAGANLAFVTAMPSAVLTLGPPAMADMLCTQRAQAAGHAGMFVAWTSTATSDAKDRLGMARGWVRHDGRPVVDTVADLVMGKLYYPLRKDEAGNDRAIAVLTGTLTNGTASGEDCLGFTSESAAELGITGMSHAGALRWTSNDEGTCDQAYGVYCFQVDNAVAITPPAEVGPLAFISTGVFTPGPGGIAAADTLCTDEATMGGLAGTYRAFLATTQATALDRVGGAPAEPWVRVDGVATTRDFVTWDAPIDVAVDGAYVDERVFSGASSPTQLALTTSDNCSDWTMSGTVLSRTGSPSFAGPEAFGAGIGTCNPMRILCLQIP